MLGEGAVRDGRYDAGWVVSAAPCGVAHVGEDGQGVSDGGGWVASGLHDGEVVGHVLSTRTEIGPLALGWAGFTGLDGLGLSHRGGV